MSATTPGDGFTIDEDVAFDRRLARIRRITWVVLSPALIAGAVYWRVPGSAIGSTVARAVIVYLLVLFVLRLGGKRTMSEMTTFDFAILLILAEALEPALVGEDSSLTNAALAVVTLVAVDVLLGLVKEKFPGIDRWLDDKPTVLVRDGMPIPDALTRSRVNIDDIMEAARHQHGLARFAEVRHAVLERTGGISVIPRRPADTA
jgi:uncharacterized membrane protein YcaP (DUF421 family)